MTLYDLYMDIIAHTAFCFIPYLCTCSSYLSVTPSYIHSLLLYMCFSIRSSVYVHVFTACFCISPLDRLSFTNIIVNRMRLVYILALAMLALHTLWELNVLEVIIDVIIR